MVVTVVPKKDLHLLRNMLPLHGNDCGFISVENGESLVINKGYYLSVIFKYSYTGEPIRVRKAFRGRTVTH